MLRSTGWISRNTNPYREEPAGPELAIPAAQMRGRHSFSFAIYPHDGVQPGPDVLEQAERYRLPFLTAAGAGEAGELTQAEGLTLDGERRRPDGASSERGPGRERDARAANGPARRRDPGAPALGDQDDDYPLS